MTKHRKYATIKQISQIGLNASLQPDIQLALSRRQDNTESKGVKLNTSIYTLSIKIKDGKIKIEPREIGINQSHQNVLRGFSLTLADRVNQEGDYLQYLIDEAISEAIMSYLASTGCIEEYFEHECYETPDIEVVGNFASQVSLDYDLTVEVTDYSSSATWATLSEYSEEDWQNLRPKDTE